MLQQKENINPPRVFISHTNQNKIDRYYAFALAVEFRRVGIDVWVDWEHSAPNATDEQKAAGPTPKNPLFQHIVSALCECDAVIYIISQTSFSREFVRLEFDPRVVYEEYRKAHPDISPDNIPFYLVLVEPLPDAPFQWLDLVSSICAGRCLNMIDDRTTPLLIPTVLTSMIKDIAPEYLLPLDPVLENVARFHLEDDAKDAPGCPSNVSPKIWRRLEGLFGLGPLFPGKLSSLSEDELWYGAVRTGQSIKAMVNYPITTFREPDINLLWLYWSNIMLRSRIHRGFNGKDDAIEITLPGVLSTAMKKQDSEAIMAVKLAFGYAFLTSSLHPNLHEAASLLVQCRYMFSEIGASSLWALSDVLCNRALNTHPSAYAKNIVEDLGFDSQAPDLHYLYHGMLDACFPGPRLEATPSYRTYIRTFLTIFKDASASKIGYGKTGDGEFPPEFFKKISNKSI